MIHIYLIKNNNNSLSYLILAEKYKIKSLTKKAEYLS